MLPDPALAEYRLLPPVSFFALPAVGTNNTTVGVRTTGGDYLWKTYQTRVDPSVLRAEHRLLRWLDAQPTSFAVPVPLRTRAGDTLCATPEGPKALFPLLVGQRPVHADPRQIEAVGSALGELHTFLCRYPRPADPHLPSYRQLDRIHPLVADSARLTPQQLGLAGTPVETELCGWWRGAVANLTDLLASTYPGLPHQMIHGDFAPSNTLYAHGRVTAVLDFEMATWDARAMDIAAGLKWSMRVGEHADPWAFGARFCRGYGRWLRLTEAEIGLMSELIKLRDAASAVWWLGRTLAASTKPASLQRIRDLQTSSQWLDRHTGQLAQMLAQTME